MFRHVFQMGLADTRVKSKQGKTLVVLTEVVKKAVTNFEKFKERMEKDLA